MALTAQDKAFLDKQKAKGLSFDEAWSNLQTAKSKLGLTGGSYLTRASSTAEIAPGASTATVEKAGQVKENIGQINEDLDSSFEKTHPVLSAIGKNAEVINPVGLTKEVGKGLIKAGAGVASLAEKGLEKIGIGEDTGQTLGQKIQGSEALKSDSALGKAANFAGQYIVPAVAGGIAGGTAKVLGGGSKIAQGLLGFLGSSVGGTTAYSVADRGELPTGKELATGAVIDAATLGAFKAIPKLAGGTKNVFSKLYNTVKNKGASEMTIETLDQLKKSGVDAQSIMESLVKQEEAYVKDQISNPSVLSTVGKNIFKDYVGELIPAKQSVGKDIADAVAAVDDYFPGRGIVGMTTEGTLNSLETGLKDIGAEATDKGLDFSKSSIKFNEANQNTLKKVYNSLLSYIDKKHAIPPSEKWAIAQSLDDLTEYNSKLASQTTSSVELPLVQLKKNLMDDVKAALEEGGENVGLFKKYADLSTAVELLNKRFGEGGEGGFSILKALKGEQKFGEEARKALGIMKNITGVDYFQQVKMALAAADIAGNEQVKSLLSTTSGKGAIMDVIKEGFLDKKLLLKQLKEEAPDLSKEVLNKAVSALAKALGLELVAGE